jgi:hypothetical protein
MAEVMSERVERTEHVPEQRRSLALAAGFFLAPLAWGTQLLVNYSLTQTVCGSGQKWILHLVSFAAGLAALTGTLIARSAWTRLTSGSTLEGDPHATGRRFLALAGMGLSAFFILAILAADIPNWWLSACQR